MCICSHIHLHLCLFLCPCVCVLSHFSRVRLSATHGILQARTLEWVAISFSNFCIYCTENHEFILTCSISIHNTEFILAFLLLYLYLFPHTVKNITVFTLTILLIGLVSLCGANFLTPWATALPEHSSSVGLAFTQLFWSGRKGGSFPLLRFCKCFVMYILWYFICFMAILKRHLKVAFSVYCLYLKRL